MIKHKLNWRFWFFFILFLGTVILGARVIYMLISGQVSDHGEEMNPIFAIFASVLLTLPLSTYLFSCIIMLRQLIVYKGTALTITEKGIENTLTFIYVLAFIIVVPIKCIPWEAVTYYDDDVSNKHPYIRTNVKLVQAGFLAKAITWVFGYIFCYGFTKPKVTSDDIDCYKHRFKLKL